MARADHVPRPALELDPGRPAPPTPRIRHYPGYSVKTRAAFMLRDLRRAAPMRIGDRRAGGGRGARRARDRWCASCCWRSTRLAPPHEFELSPARRGTRRRPAAASGGTGLRQRDPLWNVRAGTTAHRRCDAFLSTNSYLTAWFMRVPIGDARVRPGGLRPGVPPPAPRAAHRAGDAAARGPPGGRDRRHLARRRPPTCGARFPAAGGKTEVTPLAAADRLRARTARRRRRGARAARARSAVRARRRHARAAQEPARG